MQTESVATLKEETKLDDNKRSEEMGRSKEINQNQDNNKNNRKRKNRRTCNKIDMKAKLERSRQSARECRARKKLRYQYLEDLVLKRENANLLLKQEINMVLTHFSFVSLL